MWEVRVTQKYTSDHGIDLEETAAFRVPELTEAGEIINTFKKIRYWEDELFHYSEAGGRGR